MSNRSTKTVAAFALAAATLLSPIAAGAAEKKTAAKPQSTIELGAPFADKAILQRQMEVPVWGWSSPGTKVTVGFAGQTKTATAGKDGKWMLKLDKLKASFEPREMVISDSSGKSVTLKNILVGEVWLASGQSNMQWKVQKSSCNKLKVEAVGKGDVAPIREFEVTSVYSALHPIERATGAWKNGGYTNYSAIAFAFAHRLYGELEVPVGILNCCFSQTAIQAWVPRVGFRDGKDEYTKAIYKKILETDPTTPEHKAAWDKYYQSLEDTIKDNADRVKRGQPAKAIPSRPPGNLHGNRDASWMFNGRLNPVIPYAIRGAIWNQGYANMGEGLPYYNNLHSLVRGWRIRWDRPSLPVYFHQFYCPGQKGGWKNNNPNIGPCAEMRLGTWLARDIPHTGMASQIDITGGIHYFHKAVPGQRLALHALKNQYGKKVVADGPMYRSCTVKGDKLIVEFDHAKGGLVVAEAGFNAIGKKEGSTGFADPKVIANGDDQVKIFYLADENRVWYPARMKIEGEKVVVTSPKVKSPRGVSYATAGVAFQPALYNRALLPATPFIYYDNKLVTSKTWPDKPMKIHGVTPDPASGGKLYEYRKMPILSTQFRDNAVLQAGVPVTIWGSAIHDWGYEAKGKAVIKFSFAGIEKSIPVKPGMREWKVTMPAMEASSAPKTLKAVLEIDGEVAHERVAENIVVGDVWFVSVPLSAKLDLGGGKTEKPSSIVRVIRRKAKRSMFPRPSRYSVCVSTTPKNRFASEWKDAGDDLAGAIGRRLAAKTGNPVGIVFMEGQAPFVVNGKNRGTDLDLKHWIAADDLKEAPSLMEDYKQLAAVRPGNSYYDANVRRHISAWKKYWNEYIKEMMATKRVPDGVPWGGILSMSGSVTTDASQAYNVMVHSFGPGSFKGIIFLCGEKMFEEEKAANYGAELSALANSWKGHFGGKDTQFFYTIPSKALAPKVTRPVKIKGKSTACEIGRWWTAKRGDKEDAAAVNKQLLRLVDRVVNEVYR